MSIMPGRARPGKTVKLKAEYKRTMNEPNPKGERVTLPNGDSLDAKLVTLYQMTEPGGDGVRRAPLCGRHFADAYREGAFGSALRLRDARGEAERCEACERMLADAFEAKVALAVQLLEQARGLLWQRDTRASNEVRQELFGHAGDLRKVAAFAASAVFGRGGAAAVEQVGELHVAHVGRGLAVALRPLSIEIEYADADARQ
jgi:hypothetical protein